jgi:hypothetical protein
MNLSYRSFQKLKIVHYCQLHLMNRTSLMNLKYQLFQMNRKIRQYLMFQMIDLVLMYQLIQMILKFLKL